MQCFWKSCPHAIRGATGLSYNVWVVLNHEKARAQPVKSVSEKRARKGTQQTDREGAPEVEWKSGVISQSPKQ